MISPQEENLFLCFVGESEQPGVGLLLRSGVKWAFYQHGLLSPPERGAGWKKSLQRLQLLMGGQGGGAVRYSCSLARLPPSALQKAASRAATPHPTPQQERRTIKKPGACHTSP